MNAHEKELLVRAAQERAEIVAKYDLGREEGAKIDTWEDPQFEVYAVTDRYGFIHNTPLPNKATLLEAKVILTEAISRHHIPKQIEFSDMNAKQLEIDRTQKWLKMIKQWNKYMSGDKGKFTSRIRKGIPDSLRGEIWTRLLNLNGIKKEQEGVYEEMKERARQWSPDVRQIDLDVNRTYRNHIMFRERYNVKQQHLFHVLTAYSMYNTEVGYCQGMSQVAAILLMYMDEEDAFWGMSALLTDKTHAMHGLFIPGFPKLLRFQEHQDTVLQKFLPKLKKHMDKQEINTNLYTVKWLMQCFLDRIPFRMCLRLWDVYMLQGESVLVSMSYNILKMHRKRLLKMDMEELVNFLQIELEKDFGFTDDQMMDSLQICVDELKKAKLLLPPRPSDARELPHKPFGLFVPPSVEQVIGRRTIESERELIQGKRRSAGSRQTSVSPERVSGSYPPPSVGSASSSQKRQSREVSRLSQASSSAHSPGLNYSVDTMNASRDSTGYQTSRTSNWDSDGASLGTSLDPNVTLSYSRQNSSERRTYDVFHSPKNSSRKNHHQSSPAANVEAEFENVSHQMDDLKNNLSQIAVTERNNQVNKNPSKNGVSKKSKNRDSVSNESDYDNLNPAYQQNFGSNMDAHKQGMRYSSTDGVTVINVNGYNGNDTLDANSYNRDMTRSRSAHAGLRNQQKTQLSPRAKHNQYQAYVMPTKISSSASQVNGSGSMQYSPPTSSRSNQYNGYYPVHKSASQYQNYQKQPQAAYL